MPTAKIKKCEKPYMFTYDTKISVIAEQSGVPFDAPGDMKLGKYLERKGYRNLAAMLKT